MCLADWVTSAGRQTTCNWGRGRGTRAMYYHQAMRGCVRCVIVRPLRRVTPTSNVRAAGRGDGCGRPRTLVCRPVGAAAGGCTTRQCSAHNHRSTVRDGTRSLRLDRCVRAESQAGVHLGVCWLLHSRVALGLALTIVTRVAHVRRPGAAADVDGRRSTRNQATMYEESPARAAQPGGPTLTHRRPTAPATLEF